MLMISQQRLFDITSELVQVDYKCSLVCILT